MNPSGPSPARATIAVLVAVVTSGGLYASTAARTIAGGDSAELALATTLGGVPHPPGYPLYTLASALLARALPLASPAAAAHLTSGVFAALAVGLAVLLVWRLGAGAAGLLATGLALALGRTFWAQATVSEVYTFDVLLALATLHAALSLARAPRASRALAFGTLLGFWLGHRPVNLLFVPGVLLLGHGWIRGRRPSVRQIGLAVAAAVGSLAVYAYLPWISSGDPALDVGDPESWERFWVVVRATPYLRHLEGGTAALAWARLGRALAALPFEVGPAVLLAPLALVALARARSLLALGGWLWILGASLLFGARYHVLDVEVFFLPATVVLALCAAFGAEALAGTAPVRRRLVVAALALIGLAPLASRYPDLDRSQRHHTDRFARDLLASCESDALLFVNGDTSIHALWYLQAVEALRTDVAVISLGHVRPWYVEQLQRRFPNVPWPVAEATTTPSAWGRALVEAVADDRPVYLSLAVDPSPFVQPGSEPGQRDFGSVPRGLVAWLLPYGAEVDAGRLSDFQSAFFARTLPAWVPLDPAIDMDTKSIVSQYALALQGACDLWAARNERARLRTGCELILSLDPDRHERDVRLDVWRGLGQEVPKLELGRRARERLAGL